MGTMPFRGGGCDGSGAPSADGVDPADPSCLRLRCGHAFHAGCIMATFRSGIGCPVCRDPLQLVAPRRAAVARAAMDEEDANGGINAHVGGGTDDDEDDYDSVADIDLVTVTRLDERLSVLRSTMPSIQAARSALRESLRSYRILCDGLRNGRRRALDAALREFRHDRMPTFTRAKRAVEQALREVERRELAALSAAEPAEDVRMFTQIASQFEYRLHHVLESQDYTSVDPLSRRFWTR